MKKIILIVVILLSFAGCAHRSRNLRYTGWEYVRIEEKVPSKDCVYKVQDVCTDKGPEALIWFKKHARLYGANTVVLTKNLGGSSGSVAITPVGAKFNSDNLAYMAEYYDCPKCEKEQVK